MKKAFLFLAAALMLLASCHKDENVVEEDSSMFARTVLIYVAGDNNLTGMDYSFDYFSSDLRQIVEGSEMLGDNNKLILFVDHYKYPPYFLQVENGDTIHLETMATEMKSSDPNTLYEAMKYAIDNFAAKSYGLVLWGHADGWITRSGTAGSASKAPRRAYGLDRINSRTWMNIPEMAKALEKLPKLDFIFADCCCFLCVEDVYELRKCANYIIGSAAEIPAEGAPYNTVVPAMFSQSSDFYKQIVDRYYEQTSNGNTVSMAAVKTSELENLAQATVTTLKSFAANIEPDEDGCRYPDMDGIIYYFDHTQYDMQDFMYHYAATDQYAEWKRVFDKAVPYRTFSKRWRAEHVSNSGFASFSPTEEREGGLGMFVPQRETDAAKWDISYRSNLGITMKALNNAIKKMQWYEAAKLSDMGW